MTVTLGSVEDSLSLVYAADWDEEVNSLLFFPKTVPPGRTIADALELITARSVYDLPHQLLPLAVVDEGSIAVVALPGCGYGLAPGSVARWHLDDVPVNNQLALLDVDPAVYVYSVSQELQARSEGIRRILDEIGPAYQEAYLDHEKRPRDFVVRPVRIACQNVIVGLAAIAQDSTFDGLSVVAWQTCEVPHVATHEGNRALAALMLADAFQNGGTMEIRFDRSARVVIGGAVKTYDGHPERAVAASFRRYGRTVGVTLGAEDPGSISPAEACGARLFDRAWPGLRAEIIAE